MEEGSGGRSGGEATIDTGSYEGKGDDKPREEKGSIEKADFLERGLGERRGGSKKGKSIKKGMDGVYSIRRQTKKFHWAWGITVPWQL